MIVARATLVVKRAIPSVARIVLMVAAVQLPRVCRPVRWYSNAQQWIRSGRVSGVGICIVVPVGTVLRVAVTVLLII